MDDGVDQWLQYQTVSIGDLAVVSPPSGSRVLSSSLSGMIALVTDAYDDKYMCQVLLQDGRTIYVPTNYLNRL